jgi:hypothetical protein
MANEARLDIGQVGPKNIETISIFRVGAILGEGTKMPSADE